MGNKVGKCRSSSAAEEQQNGQRPLKFEDINDLRENFKMFDKDGDGRITSAEIAKVLQGVNITITEEEVKEMMREVDMDGNGTIEFEEFCSMMAEQLSAPVSEEDIVEAFKMFDFNGDGLISGEELTRVLTGLNLPMTQNRIDALLKATDENGDGDIDYKEFAKELLKVSLINKK